MDNKFKNKYRTTSTRLQNWDYRWNGYYFITICTKDKKEYFGKIIDGEMILSSLGVIADILWYEIKNHTINIELDAFVVMPNHIHGIIIISNNDNMEMKQSKETIGKQRFQNQGKNSLSSIVGAYKSAVSKHIHRLGFEFQWQGRFYDNIIRDEQSYQKIVEYVENNPFKWEEDMFFM